MLNAINRQHLNAWATGLAAGVNIVLNLILIPFYGYLAASATTVVTEAALCVFGWWFVQRQRPDLRLPWLRLSWRVFVAGMVMGAVLYVLRSRSIFISVPAGSIVYVVAIYLIRAIEPEEWALVRHGLLARFGGNRTRAAR